jgi:ParB-like chromosome segregation protein Spo0J
VTRPRAYRQLISEHGYTQRNPARQIGRSQSHIAKLLALLELPEDIRSEVDSGGITLSDAAELARFARWPDRLEAARKQGRNNGGIEAAVRQQLRQQEAEAAAKKAAKELSLVGNHRARLAQRLLGQPAGPTCLLPRWRRPR